MLMDTLGWEHEGQEVGSWDQSRLGFDEAWQSETNEHASSVMDKKSRINGLHSELAKLDKGKRRASDQDAH